MLVIEYTFIYLDLFLLPFLLSDIRYSCIYKSMNKVFFLDYYEKINPYAPTSGTNITDILKSQYFTK